MIDLLFSLFALLFFIFIPILPILIVIHYYFKQKNKDKFGR